MKDDDTTNDVDDAVTEVRQWWDDPAAIHRVEDELRDDTVMVIGAFFAVFGAVCFLFIFGLGLYEFFNRLF